MTLRNKGTNLLLFGSQLQVLTSLKENKMNKLPNINHLMMLSDLHMRDILSFPH